MIFKCGDCSARSDVWMPYCPNCGSERGLLSPAAMASPRGSRGKTLADAPPLGGTRVQTGIDGLDKVLGTDWRTKAKGLRIPSTVLFAAAAGTGKSTMLLKVGAEMKFKSRERKFLYLTSEQTLSEIRENAERCEFTTEQIRRIQAEEVHELQDALKCMRRYNPQVVVMDSLNELIDTPNDTGDVQANLIRMVTEFKKESEQKERGIILITHMNKKEDVAGVQRLQHIVSAVMKLERDEIRKRLVLGCPKKNRFGSTAEKAYFLMTPRGLVETVDAADHEEDPENKKKRSEELPV